jgi:SAM-dependent methyltransferase
LKQSIKALDERFYPAYTQNWDDALFRERILSYLRPTHTILDLGAGSGLVEQMNFRGRCKAVHGIDPEQSVLSNPYLDVARLGTAEEIPAEVSTYDMIFADNVLEHLVDPSQVFKEAFRTLKPGGIFLGKTPNKFHYVPLIAQLTPTRFHKLVNNLRGRSESDTFPTLYRANSRGKLVDLAREASFEILSIEQIEGRPEYLRISPLVYPLGLLWERMVNFTEFLSGLRVLLIAAFKKPLNSFPGNTDKADGISGEAS